MAVIGIYDYDFFHYGHVMPNLECAKLCAYHRNHNDITVFTKKFDPAPYSKYIIRKDYDDGEYDFLTKDLIYGGHAFSGDKYAPLDLGIEKTVPNMGVYSPFIDRFAKTETDRKNFKSLLNANHLRLSLDGRTIWNKYESQIRWSSSSSYIVLHDYNLGEIKDAAACISELSKRITFNGKELYRTIGTKFPIQIDNYNSLKEWNDIFPNSSTFFFQYNGLLEDGELYEFIKCKPRILKTLIYNIGEGWFSSNEFFEKVLPKIFKQILFLRREKIKISLICENKSQYIDKNIIDLVQLLDNYSRSLFIETASCSLFKHIKNKHFFMSFKYYDIERIKELFNMTRIKNYEAFKMFYEWDRVKYEKGEFINDW